MKKSSLTTAVLAGLAGVVGFAGSSSAVELNADGTGQVLIYPYYTARANQQTLVSVVNSGQAAQSVKVRILEGYASKEVLDFNLFLSPYDVWTGTIFSLADAGLPGDGAAIGTSDKSCTVPDFQALPVVGGLHYQSFSNAYYTNKQFDPDKGPQGTDRTNEGYVELIAMGDILDDQGTATAVTHVQQPDANGFIVPGMGKPKSCSPALLDSPANTDLTSTAPSGGLFGSGAIVNVGEGTFYSYNADAIDGFTQMNLFTQSGSLNPSLESANDGALASDVTAHVFDHGTLVTATFTQATNAVDAVSAVFDSSALLNEWQAGGSTNAGTDWVVTFPTKRFYVNAQYVGSTAAAPFAEALDEKHAGAACVAVGLKVWDREEGSQNVIPGGPVFSPAPEIVTEAPSLCHEVNVISVSDPSAPSSILGSQYKNSDGGMGLALNVPTFGTAGWMRIDFVNNIISEAHTMTSNNAIVFNGLPATGFEAVRVINTNAQPGKLSNYSGVFRHRAERSIGS